VRVALQDSRAWLKLTPVRARVSYDGVKFSVTIKIEAENIGATPAVDVNFDATIYEARRTVAGKKEIEALITKWKLLNFSNNGQIVLPRDKTAASFTADAKVLARDYVPTGLDKIDEVLGAGGGILTLSVACSVFYKSAGAEEQRHSAHVVWLIKRDKTQFNETVGPVPSENIRLKVLGPDSDIS
jgi:hypothetical protein